MLQKFCKIVNYVWLLKNSRMPGNASVDTLNLSHYKQIVATFAGSGAGAVVQL